MAGLKPCPTQKPVGFLAAENLELTERLELSTSPLPRECSTTELRQPVLQTTLLSYRERSLPSTTRNAKNANRIKVSDLYLPGSIVK
jgi:hypothetical protein